MVNAATFHRRPSMSPIMTVDQVTMHAHSFQYYNLKVQRPGTLYGMFYQPFFPPVVSIPVRAWILNNITVVHFPRRNSKSISAYKRPIRSSVKHSISKYGAHGLSRYTAVNIMSTITHQHHAWKPMWITSNISYMSHFSHHVLVSCNNCSIFAHYVFRLYWVMFLF